MGIMDKVKELGNEIVKTVDESGLKENVKCATMAISDTVEKGKKEFENRMEESKRKIEEEKKFIKTLETSVVIDVNENYDENSKTLDLDQLQGFATKFSEKLCAIKDREVTPKIKFGDNVPEDDIKKFLRTFKDDVNELDEKPIFSYSGSKKRFFVLTNKNFYFNMKHPVEDLIYSGTINADIIQSIELKTEDMVKVFKLNGINIFCIDEDLELMDMFIEKVNRDDLEIRPREIIEIIKQVKLVDSKVVLDLIEWIRLS